MYGTDAEKRLLDEVVTAMEKARAARDATELERQLRLVRRLGTAAFQRSPEAWQWYFEDAAADAAQATDLPRAHQLVAQGKIAAAAGDTDALKRIVKELWGLLPVDAASRRASFDSGIR
jgi:molecular chaperone DnaK